MINTIKPDERSVMAYVSSYYHAFSGAQQVIYWNIRLLAVLIIPILIVLIFIALHYEYF